MRSSTPLQLCRFENWSAVERVLVAANYGEPSTVTLITRSVKAVLADRLLALDH